MRYYVITFLVGLIVTTVIAVLVGIEVESKCNSFSLGVLSGFGVWMLELALLALGFDRYFNRLDGDTLFVCRYGENKET